MALTDDACAAPDVNSIPAFTHLHAREVACCCCGRGIRVPVVRVRGRSEDVLVLVVVVDRARASGVGPVKITNPPWSHSISQSALTVTSAMVKRFRREVKIIGAVAMSPVGGFRQRLVLGPAVSEK